ncbi:hypothetical protein ARMGADRAFT_1071001 [Armillaria gallica]|uniref:Uncharacterized protein n=1 Tax=Armillaria gallica TaxID=47427 RepID=A0A2H3F1X4_ARMGA|nr:hypothetical protein ARMGADRAFT_1071001 [Armillaria gallica]
MNRLGTGYKAHRHIGKALKAQSHAIRGLVNCYNAAAKALEPPQPMLKWEDVVEYTFLSEFDLLKDMREDIREKPWANSAIREASDAYYQIIRAQEEVHWLNIEIHRFVTKIKAEEKYLQQAVDELKREELGLSALDDATDHHEGDTNISDDEEEEGEEVAETQKQQDIESIMTAFSD